MLKMIINSVNFYQRSGAIELYGYLHVERLVQENLLLVLLHAVHLVVHAYQGIGKPLENLHFKHVEALEARKIIADLVTVNRFLILHFQPEVIKIETGALKESQV